jgi:5-methyltetrahydropteroyltriglutamate--homocysteine methyltransferase
VRAKELWRVAAEFLERVQDYATILAIRDQERAGLDIITDAEMRRVRATPTASQRRWTASTSIALAQRNQQLAGAGLALTPLPRN